MSPISKRASKAKVASLDNSNKKQIAKKVEFVLTPRMSEKAYAQSSSLNTYVFNVPLDTNKIMIKNAVQDAYEVKVETVNIVKQNGKLKRTYRKGGRSVSGKRSDFKKAYVKLAQGQTIPVFAAQEEAEAK